MPCWGDTKLNWGGSVGKIFGLEQLAKGRAKRDPAIPPHRSRWVSESSKASEYLAVTLRKSPLQVNDPESKPAQSAC